MTTRYELVRKTVERWEQRVYAARVTYVPKQVMFQCESEITTIDNINRALDLLEDVFGSVENMPEEHIKIDVYTSARSSQMIGTSPYFDPLMARVWSSQDSCYVTVLYGRKPDAP